MQIHYVDFMEKNRTFGPVFHKDEFLIPLLELQEEIKNLVAEYQDGDKVIKVKLTDVCNDPLSRPDRKTEYCNIQSIWAYWQDDLETFETPVVWEDGNGRNLTYFDHFIQCSR